MERATAAMMKATVARMAARTAARTAERMAAAAALAAENDGEGKSAVPAVHTANQDEGLGITEDIAGEVASALESHSTNYASPVNINRLKVPELKKMVSTQGLASPGRIQNMKKKDLIELLK